MNSDPADIGQQREAPLTGRTSSLELVEDCLSRIADPEGEGRRTFIRVWDDQARTIATLVAAGIPVIAHVGLRPQSVHALGGYKVMRDGEKLTADAIAAEEAGACAVLIECVPSDLAAQLTERLKVPTIGIGAGPHCDGQVLVTHDMLGLTSGYVPKFVRPWAQLGQDMQQAFAAYREGVRAGTFPDANESFQ